MDTRIVSVSNTASLGWFLPGKGLGRLDRWQVAEREGDDADASSLSAIREAAHNIKTTDTPVAFPTETVYGLGADATRSASVKGIYAAKGRPSDNPLIVHVCDLTMLREYIRPATAATTAEGGAEKDDTIPSIYKPLMDRFWPGPLTVLLPNPRPSKLAPEVTAGLPTFGVRMPDSPLALSLISLAGVPVAAPSANASTKPSPTAARHVMDDLRGRIALILDGGACGVGVESTVVDGLCDPPAVLRPGGVGLDELRECPGWEGVVKGYKDQSEEGKAAPRAPGMKYKHYSPKARVVLYEASYEKGAAGVLRSDVVVPAANEVNGMTGGTGNGTTNGASTNKPSRTIGIIRTHRWKSGAGLPCAAELTLSPNEEQQEYQVYQSELLSPDGQHVVGQVLDIDLGRETEGIARGLFSALREFDRRGADVIFVDGIEDRIDMAAAVMNRLRKAASEIRA